MDEDAYRLLDKYLHNLRIYFRSEEGSTEIIADFEARIEELFSEKMRSGSEVITIEHVEEVIARVGKPGDFAESEDAEEEKQPFFTDSKELKKKFYRNIDDKMFGGICSGIAAYFGWDVLAVRIVFIVLLFATSFWIVPVYLLGWVLLPAANTAEQKLQMRGKPITVENIGKTVAAEVEKISTENRGCLSGFIDLAVGLMKVILVGLGFLVGLPLLFALVIVIIVLIAVFFGVGGGIFGFLPSFIVTDNPILATTTFLLLVGIPVIALIYAIIANIAKLKPVNRAVKWAVFVIWLLAFALMLSSGFRFGKKQEFSNWNLVNVFDKNIIKGNGIQSEKIDNLDEPFDYLEIGSYLSANLQIEQIPDEKSSMVINGDENLIDQVKYEIQDGRLRLFTQNRLHGENNLSIKIQTKGLKSIHSEIPGNILMNRRFTGDDLEIKLNGAGKLQADSLFVSSLTVRSEGVASIDLSGKVNRARLDLAGAGKIDAFNLLSDTVYAHVDGVGSIQCNPTELLEGHLNGIGKITYKEEPKIKNIATAGIGKIGKD